MHKERMPVDAEGRRVGTPALDERMQLTGLRERASLSTGASAEVTALD